MNYETFVQEYKRAMSDHIILIKSLEMPTPQPELSDKAGAISQAKAMAHPLMAKLLTPLMVDKFEQAYLKVLYGEGLVNERNIIKPERKAYAAATKAGMNGQQYYATLRPFHDMALSDSMDEASYLNSMSALKNVHDELVATIGPENPLGMIIGAQDVSMLGDFFIKACTGMGARMIIGLQALDQGKPVEEAIETANSYVLKFAVRPGSETVVKAASAPPDTLEA